MKNKKVLGSQWDKDPMYNIAGQYTAQDCARIVHKLVLENFLWEELVVSRDGMASAYVRRGPRAQQLLAGEVKFELDMQQKSKSTRTSLFDSHKDEKDEELKRLEEDCLEALKAVILSEFPSLKSCYTALPVECFQEIARKLPCSKSEMMEVDQMTEARFANYGVHLLSVCDDYFGRRMAYLADKQVAELLQKEEDRAFDNDDVFAGAAATSSGRSRYVQNFRVTYDKEDVSSFVAASVGKRAVVAAAAEAAASSAEEHFLFKTAGASDQPLEAEECVADRLVARPRRRQSEVLEERRPRRGPSPRPSWPTPD
jgi:hypothetical protein